MNLCEECTLPDDSELPAPLRTITNSTFEGVLQMHAAMAAAHDYVATLLPDDIKPALPADLTNMLLATFEPLGMHGAVIREHRYCVPCHWLYDTELSACPQCAAPWDRPVSETP